MVFLDRNYIYYILSVCVILFAINLELSEPLLIALSEAALPLKRLVLVIAGMVKARIPQANTSLCL